MQKFVCLLISLFIGISLQAQDCQSDRYRLPIFEDVQVTKNVVYSTADAYDFLNQDNPEDYHIDIYEPLGDTQAKRPVVFTFFGGSFLNGDKEDRDIVAWGDSLARHGYVVVAVNYRLGMNVVDSGSPIRAVYRAVQDADAAIRYMIEFKDTYRIDPEHIYMLGKSAGAVLVYTRNFMGTEADRPPETFGTLLEPTDLGCVSCSGNPYNHTYDIKGQVGLWGAVIDLNVISASENIPTILIHGNGDSVVPFDEGYPFSGPIPLTFPYMYGSLPMSGRLTDLGIYNEFYEYDYDDHDVYGSGTFPNENWDAVFTQSRDFLVTNQLSTADTPSGELEVCPGQSYIYETSDLTGAQFCWTVSGGEIISQTDNQVEIVWEESGGSLGVSIENQIGFPLEPAEPITVDIKPLPMADFDVTMITDDTYYFADASANINGYWFDPGDGTTPFYVEAGQSVTYIYTTSGMFDVIITVSGECGEDEFTTQVNAIASSTVSIEALGLEIFPSLATDELQILGADTPSLFQYEIVDISGRKMKAGLLSGQIIRVEDLPEGIYLLHISSGEEQGVFRFAVAK